MQIFIGFKTEVGKDLQHFLSPQAVFNKKKLLENYRFSDYTYQNKDLMKTQNSLSIMTIFANMDIVYWSVRSSSWMGGEGVKGG